MSDFTLGDTRFFGFTSSVNGLPTTLAGTPVVSAYEDASLIQITAGVSISADHDGVTGFNMITVAATAANGFEANKQYHLVVTTGTINGVSVAGNGGRRVQPGRVGCRRRSRQRDRRSGRHQDGHGGNSCGNGHDNSRHHHDPAGRHRRYSSPPAPRPWSSVAWIAIWGRSAPARRPPTPWNYRPRPLWRARRQQARIPTTEMTTDLTVSVAGQYNGRIIIFQSDTTTAALRNQATDINATTVLNGKLGFTALTTEPVHGDKFIIV